MKRESPIPEPTPVGRVEPEERDLIQSLYQRKTGLTTLFASLTRMTDNELLQSSLYERLVREMGQVETDYQDWWDTMAEKYNWPRQSRGGWRIHFDSCQIYCAGAGLGDQRSQSAPEPQSGND